MVELSGVSYLRTAQGPTPVLYPAEDEFEIGGSRVLRSSESDQITLVAAGITLHDDSASFKNAWESALDRLQAVKNALPPADRNSASALWLDETASWGSLPHSHPQRPSP
jgi:hypothetical protein